MRRQLDEINDLLNEWDPIAVKADLKSGGLPLEEYREYAPRLLALLRAGVDARAVEMALLAIVADEMGIPPDRERERRAARALIGWFAARHKA